LFSGAFDERIALTLAQESGGGGATSWRYSHSEPNGTVEKIDNTDYNWFKNSMNQFAGNSVWRMPEDHHELMSMVAPRALFVTANPDYTWLSNPSCHVCSNACKEVYNVLDIADRFGYSIIGGHPHCQIPGSPALNTDSSYFGKISLVYPTDNQSGLDTTITLKWNSVTGAEMYHIQLSLNPSFVNVSTTDSTIDTLKTINSLLEGKKYYWRVQVKSAEGTGPWSNVGHFSTTISLPVEPELISAVPYPNRPGWFTFTWKKTKYADQYLLQTSMYEAFTTIFQSATTSDTTLILMQFQEGQEYFWRVQASNIAGNGPWSEIFGFNSTVDVYQEEGIPTEYSLSQNYPNPFNPSTKIKFALPQAKLTKITVYDLLGEEVQKLIDRELEAGYYEINFDASKFQSGVYFYRIQSGNFISTNKMILMK
ncbi:MAG: T9SS type A sorting domain-containing protein, partial [Ignavibacteriaceae bacterium]